jgi:hypothetical protein
VTLDGFPRPSDATVVSALPSAVDEAEHFWRYLFGARPSPSTVSAYASDSSRAHIGPPKDRFDVFLVRWALRGGVTARAADLYARFLRPNAWLRRKLVLLLALGEVDGPGARVFHTPVAGGLLAFLCQAGLRGVWSVVALALSLPVLVVAHAAGRSPVS